MALPANTIAKLDDYFGQYVICVRCHACRHFFEVSPVRLARQYGWQAAFAEVAPKIPCSKCHALNCLVEIAFEKRPRSWRTPS